MATASIAISPNQPIHLYFLIHFDIIVATVAISIIDKIKPKTNKT